MRYKIIALKHKAYRAVAVIIPVCVTKLLCGLARYDKVALGVAVKPADYIKKRGFSAARLTEYRHKFIFTKTHRHTLERRHRLVARFIGLYNIF